MKATTASPVRAVTFEITTMAPLPVGEQVFIAGNVEGLGRWHPAGMPLTRVHDLLWTATVILPADEIIEYKITRGSWDAEESRIDRRIPKNYRIESSHDDIVKHRVHHWKDHRVPQPDIEGDYRIHADIPSRHLRYARNVIVWLPPSYEKEKDRRYPVLYMQDGEQVFDPNTSTWNQDWEVDEWCSKLIEENRLQEIIVVGVYSSPDRFLEYNPAGAGHAYEKFLLEELKPFIDQEYRTVADRNHTAIAGSSLGATMAFYMAWNHPETFFGAACLSSAFTFKDDPFLCDQVKNTGQAPDIRLYLYCGKGDDLEQRLARDLHTMADLLRAKGFDDGRNLKVVEDPHGPHNEAAWARHTDHWLLFLFGK